MGIMLQASHRAVQSQGDHHICDGGEVRCFMTHPSPPLCDPQPSTRLG